MTRVIPPAGGLDWLKTAPPPDKDVGPPPPRPRSGTPSHWPPAAKPDGRVRVGLLCPVLLLGGAESWQLSLLEAVPSDRVRWEGVAVTGGRAASHQARVEEHQRHAPVGFGREAAAELVRRCDVLVTWAISDLPSLLPAAGRVPKVIAVAHAPEESLWGHQVYADSRGIDLYVAVSELALPTIPATGRESARVIWNAVRPKRLVPTRTRNELRASWGVPPGAKVVGYLGRLEADKNPDAVAAALAHLPPEWHAVLVGEGPRKDHLAGLAASEPRLHVPGGDTDAGSVLAALDALAVPSAFESFGLTLCEGLWAGVPVVSTRVGVCKLADGLTREFANPAGGEVLAAAVLADAADPAGTAARVERSRIWASSHVSPGYFGQQWADLLAGLSPHRTPSEDEFRSLSKRAKSCPQFVPRKSCCDGDGCQLDRNGRGWISVVDDCFPCPHLPPGAIS